MFKRSSRIDEPKLQVVQAQPWRRATIVVVMGVVGVCCILLGFALGQNRALVNRVSNALLSENLVQAEGEVAELKAQLVDSELNAQVAAAAAATLREDLAQLRSSNQQLAEEVTFYKSLMAPGSLTKGLQISELELARTADSDRFDFQLLLTQIAQRRSYIAGDVRLDVIGIRPSDDSEVVLSLTELSALDKYPLRFKFRYFQDLTGSLKLPADFEPIRILITAQQQGKAALQETFPWPDWNPAAQPRQ